MHRILSLALGGLAALAVTAPAASAANPYTPARICGSSYRVIAHHDVTGPKGGVLGTAYLTYSRVTRKNCATMIKRRAVGVPTFTEVSIAKKGGRYRSQGSDSYRYYAGPLYVYAPGSCVIYGGRMVDAKGNPGYWITPRFGHCG